MIDTYNGLPVYKLEIAEDNDGLKAISLVDLPAIKKNFLTFSEKVSFSINEDRRIVSGPVMIPDKLMYRDDNQRGKHYVYFTKEDIEQVALKYFSSGMIHSVNMMHKSAEPVEGVIMFESFLSDSARGVAPMVGYEDCPEGTWFTSYKVYNDEVWEKVKNENFKGFSVEGFFKHNAETEEIDDEVFMDILDLADLLRNAKGKI